MIKWQPMNTAPIDKRVLVHFPPTDEAPRTIQFIYAHNLTKRGKLVANAWADTNFPDAGADNE
jgi:hypothetical protein